MNVVEQRTAKEFLARYSKAEATIKDGAVKKPKRKPTSNTAMLRGIIAGELGKDVPNFGVVAKVMDGLQAVIAASKTNVQPDGKSRKGKHARYGQGGGLMLG